MKRLPWKKLAFGLILAYTGVQLAFFAVQTHRKHDCDRQAGAWLERARIASEAEQTPEDAVAWLRHNGFHPVLRGPGEHIAPGIHDCYEVVCGYRPLCAARWPFEPAWLALEFKFELTGSFQSVESKVLPFQPFDLEDL